MTSTHQANGGGGAAEAEIEGNYTPEEREFIRNFYAEYEAAEDPKPDEDERAVYDSGYKMYSGGEEPSLNIEWDAAMGKTDYWNLPPYEEFDPKVGLGAAFARVPFRFRASVDACCWCGGGCGGGGRKSPSCCCCFCRLVVELLAMLLAVDVGCVVAGGWLPWRCRRYLLPLPENVA